MKKRTQGTYTHLEVIAIIQAVTGKIIEDFKNGIPPSIPEVAPPPGRAYRMVGTRTPASSPRSSLERCDRVGHDIRESVYADDDGVHRPYCHTCWAANKDGR